MVLAARVMTPATAAGRSATVSTSTRVGGPMTARASEASTEVTRLAPIAVARHAASAMTVWPVTGIGQGPVTASK